MTETPVVTLASADVLAAVQSVVDAFQSGDTAQVEAALARIGSSTHSELYTRIGKMTRTLHNSLDEFKVSLDRSNMSMSTTNLPDAADKLRAVMALTAEAAHRTLGLVEQHDDVLAKLDVLTKTLESRLTSPTWSEASQRGELLQLVAEQHTLLMRSRELSSEILIAQEFQDLTGQALKKVALLVSQLETQLLDLVRSFGGAPAATEPVACVPANDPTATSTGKLDQEDADSILTQFGF